jgi:hypothetical protein
MIAVIRPYIPLTPAIIMGMRFFHIRSGEEMPDIMIPVPALPVPYAAPISKITESRKADLM